VTPLLKIDVRPDQSVELQYVNSGVPCAVVCWNGRGTLAVAGMIRDAVNDNATVRLERAELWGVLNALRVAIRFSINQPPGKAMDSLREMLPRINEVLEVQV